MNKILKRGLTVIGICVVIVLGLVAYYFIAITKLDAVKTVNISQVADGVYIGEQDAFPVSVRVEITVKDHKITNLQILKHKNGRGKKAESMVEDIIDKNTSDVDEVSGATMSSKTIKAAVNNALKQGE